MAQTINAIVLGRRDTMAAWMEQNPIPLNGELVIATDLNRIKLGDGKTRFADLPFIGTDGKNIEVAFEGDVLKVRREGDPDWISIIVKGLIDGKDTKKPSRGQKGDKGDATVLTISEDGYAILDGVKTDTLIKANPTELLTYVNGKAVLWNIGIVNGEPVLNWRDKV